MKKALCNVLIFAAGATFGSLFTWKFLKTKYEQITQEEIESVKETWARMNDEPEVEIDKVESKEDLDDSEQVSMDDYAAYTDYSALVGKYNRALCDEPEEEGGGDVDDEDDVGFPYINGPVVITPEEFGDGNYGHSLYCLTYYADGVLADDWWAEQSIEDTIGEEALEHFGDYEEDVVHVRNEQNEADYEVTRDPRRYTDVIKLNPLMNTNEN